MSAVGIHFSQIENKNFLFMPSDLESDHFTEKNIQFVLKLAEDSADWQSVMRTKAKKSEKEYYAYVSRAYYTV